MITLFMLQQILTSQLFAKMKNSDPIKLVEVRSSKYPARFNQQSTNNLLKQLEISLHDVEALIIKSKTSLGIDSVPRQSLQSSPSNASQIHFRVSTEGTDSGAHDELTYSMTPGTQSRIMSESLQTKAINMSPPKNILRKLVYEQAESIIQPDQKQTKINTSHVEFARTQIISQNEKHVAQKRLQTKETETPVEEINEQTNYRYDQYHIVINKTKMIDDDDRIEEEENQEEELTTKKFTYYQCQSLPRNEPKSSLIKKDFSKKFKPIAQQNGKKQVINSKQHTQWNTQSRIDRVKIFKQRVQKYCAAINQVQVPQKGMIEQNTCAKNELENILVMNYQSRKSQQKIGVKAGDSNKKSSQSKSKEKGKSQILSPSNKKCTGKSEVSPKLQSPSKAKPKSKSPNLSPLKTAYRSGPNFHSPINIKSKPTFIQKYANNLKTQKLLGREHKLLESPKREQRIFKYSHPSKSPNKKNCSVFQIQEHKKSYPQNWNREQFVDKMLEQCYVRRFLTKPELSKIYQQFCRHKIPRYQWEEKVIEKIFKKIHQFDQII